MDIVDTLRRNKRVVERELASDTQEQTLLERLKTIYGAQGIEVSDEILKEGIQALREDRFIYKPSSPSFSRLMATIYVRRAKWGKPLLGLALLFILIFCAYTFSFTKPKQLAEHAQPIHIINPNETLLEHQ